MSTDALQLIGVHKSFGATPIIRGLDLAVRQGERNRFHARITPTEYEWYLTTV